MLPLFLYIWIYLTPPYMGRGPVSPPAHEADLIWSLCFSFYVAYGGTVTTNTTITKVTIVNTVNCICILWQYFVLSKFLQFLTQVFAVSFCVLGFLLCFQFLTVFSVYHYAFSFSLCFQFLTVISVSYCDFSFLLCFSFLCSFWWYCYYYYYN